MPKPLIQYVYSCTNAFFVYLNKGEDLGLLITDLRRTESHAELELGGKDNTLWFKFGDDDTSATDIKDIRNDLSFNCGGNRNLILDKMRLVTKDIEPSNELRVFFS